MNVSAPVNVPTRLGENVTPTVQLAPTPRLVPQLLVEIVMLEIVTDTVP